MRTRMHESTCARTYVRACTCAVYLNLARVLSENKAAKKLECFLWLCRHGHVYRHADDRVGRHVRGACVVMGNLLSRQ